MGIGQFNRLEVVKIVDFGLYLDFEEYGTVLLPKRSMPEDSRIGDWIDVFIYYDSEDKLIATTSKPRVMVGQCAYLKVKDVNKTGAFLDWGLQKDLLIPYAEQHKPLVEGHSYVVTTFLDRHTNRIVASTKLDKHLDEFSTFFKAHEPVDLLVCGKSEMGYKAVINNSHIGLIFRDEAFRELRYGDKLSGYVHSIRSDLKINLCLQLPGDFGRGELTDKIIKHLEKNGGISNLTDKSNPEDIHRIFQVSKNSYKKALGALYKQKRIIIEPDKIKLLN